jgi:hypothetical protein
MIFSVPSLPVALSLAVCSVALILVLLQIWRLREACATFVLLAMWLRYSIAAFHEFTYPPVIFGLSVAALTSILVAAVGPLVVGGRRFLLRRLIPFYSIMLVIVISATLNQAWIGAVNSIVKWLYLIVVALAAHAAMCRCGADRVLGALVVVFAGPIASQWFSVLMQVQMTNEDGTPSFIGGYQHEQAFSIILLTFLFITCFMQKVRMSSAYLRVLVAIAGLVLANYRTTLLAAALPTASFAVTKLLGRFVQKQRSFVFLFLSAVTVLVFVALAHLAHDRFADIGSTLHKGASLIQPPQYFTTDEKRLFSGRIYLWSQYVDGYMRGTITEKLIGAGPEAWVGKFPIYAHNTFISFLYELGIFGTSAFVWLLIANLMATTRIHGEARPVLLACHVGFFVLNLATMPIWTIEGDIAYALLIAQTWYLQSLQSAKQTPTEMAVGPTPRVYGRGPVVAALPATKPHIN